MMPANFFFEFWSRGGAGFVRAMGPIATEYGGFGKGGDDNAQHS
ncbi:hypothetical protein FEAC_29040 [Ferrimicrobium acidiphilum DSM 19497]|uniref:Uncharacterized protein n=1 Tax=Ferrimicrobium acidiphilum DSM 19497 TaxID=1121877 RepID=A0A0D8FQ17_9ACTN|nr:hypothetical protein FEAC_29040 [Ferrimicrobium acidiphilum DSM 19497]